jgi:signal transduction histidine kinase
MLTAALDNLLRNAWKFSRRTETARIEVGSENGKDGKPVYFVKDNGAGFDPSYSAKLFQVFQRLHSSREFEGTGIGLATVHRIISRHGGRIWANSEPGHGAQFYFDLPNAA